VISLNEAQEMLLEKHVMPGDVVFWINDHEAGTPEFAYLSAKSAWAMAQEVRKASVTANITILYNHEMRVPLSGQERVLSRKLGINWQPYSPGFTTTVQAQNLTYCDPVTHLEEELHFETLVVAPVRIVGTKATQTAQALGLHLTGGEFVKPELAGSALTPCDLREALRQGRNIAEEAAELVGKAKSGDLYAPAMICSVDPEKCIGCGLCREICECGGIEAVEGMGGNIPRRVDPMQCTGGGTCAAACPYEALSLRNNTNDQREARIEALSKAMAPGEIPAFGCRWGGFAAADIAGVKGMHYNPSVHMLRVGCIGQLDPSVMAKAFVSGANGLLLVGCAPEACHHSFGLDHTWSRVNLMRKLLELAGLDRRRIVLAHADMNEPEEFIRTVEAYTARINQLGPINRTPQVEERLAAMYLAVKNARVRWVLGASLRRPWEEGFPGDQHNAMDYDQNLLEVVVEEFTKGRVANLLAHSAEPQKAGDLAASLNADVGSVVESLQEMASQGMVERIHQKGDAYYSIRTLN
jgi:coenzyme F420-reducing hydrogenase delta subunit/ferredoxin